MYGTRVSDMNSVRGCAQLMSWPVTMQFEVDDLF